MVVPDESSKSGKEVINAGAVNVQATLKHLVSRRANAGTAQFLPKPSPPPQTYIDVIGEYEKHQKKASKVNVVNPSKQSPSSSGAAAMPIIAPQRAVKQYEVQVQNMKFVPSHLYIEKGSTVTWRVCPDTTSSAFSSSSTRSHILFFDDICVESPKLETGTGGRKNDTFSLSFQDFGTFTYGCCIFSRMRGCVEVVDNSERLMVP